MSSSSSSINSEQDHDRDIYDDDARELRQNNSPPMDMMSSAPGVSDHDFRYDGVMVTIFFANKYEIVENTQIIVNYCRLS